jgi:hypothetical protein
VFEIVCHVSVLSEDVVTVKKNASQQVKCPRAMVSVDQAQTQGMDKNLNARDLLATRTTIASRESFARGVARN